MKKGLLVAALVILLDQLSKGFIIYSMDFEKFPNGIYITSFFNLISAWNTGVSFSMLSTSAEYMPWILGGVALVIVTGILVWLYYARDLFHQITLGLIIGGALGNVIDRIRFGAVFDFLDFHLFGYHWPAFNVADSCISVGAVLLIGYAFIYRDKKEVKKS